jgi:hypothetical protein
LRLSRLTNSLCVLSSYLLIVVARGWRGLDQIPSDPGYEYIWLRARDGFRILEVKPYLYLDQSLLASIGASLPTDSQAIFLSIASHAIWAVCAFANFTTFLHHGFSLVRSYISGLLLVATPWAAQSAIGNYGNVRWPILVAAAIVISSEIAHKRPRVWPMTLASVAATVSNPLHPLLLALFVFGVLSLAREERKSLLIPATPLLLGLIINLLNAETGGHSSKTTSLWHDAGGFWISGQLLPISIAVVGIAFAAWTLRVARPQRVFALCLLTMVLLIVVASYQLGGIADRYFVAPGALAFIGVLVLLEDLRLRHKLTLQIVRLILALALMVPTIRWFFVFPYLRSSPGWSTQIAVARQQCFDGSITSLQLLTSDGQTMTDRISCKEL